MTKPTRQTTLTAACVAELKEASAVGASTAFAQFVGVTLLADKPVVRDAGDALEPDTWKTGVFFEIHGEFVGHIAILLGQPARDAVTALLESTMEGSPSDEARDSIVLELGNVVASQVVSAIADRMQGRIVLSIPHMVKSGAERELEWRARHSTLPGASARSTRVETEFADSSGRLRALVVLVPDLPDSDLDSHLEEELEEKLEEKLEENAHPGEAFDTVE